MAAQYFETDTYRRHVAELAAMGNLDPDQIKIWLGERFNIWPASIEADARRN